MSQFARHERQLQIDKRERSQDTLQSRPRSCKITSQQIVTAGTLCLGPSNYTMKGWPLQLEPVGISLMNLTTPTAERKTENESHAYNLLQHRLI